MAKPIESQSQYEKAEKIVIEKIINNNIISSLDADGEETIIMGRGIGFGKRAGNVADNKRIEKIFKLDNKDSAERFKELLASLPLEYIQVSNDIITYAKEILNIELNQNVYITLTDHISFTVDRFKKGMDFANALLEEVKLFYPNEFAVGIHALQLIESRIKVSLPEDEAASIALHLVNAELDSSISNTFTITKMIHEIMEIIEREITPQNMNPYHRDRLIINLKHLGHRLLTSHPDKSFIDPELYDFIRNNYQRDYGLINQVNCYLEAQYGCSMTEEEQIDLTLSIKRIRTTDMQF